MIGCQASHAKNTSFVIFLKKNVEKNLDLLVAPMMRSKFRFQIIVEGLICDFLEVTMSAS